MSRSLEYFVIAFSFLTENDSSFSVSEIWNLFFGCADATRLTFCRCEFFAEQKFLTKCQGLESADSVTRGSSNR